LHFAPTEWARQNLLREGFRPEVIHVTGNPVIDALRFVVGRPLTSQVEALEQQLGLRSEDPPRLLLVTAHRRENFGQPLKEICIALRQLADVYGPRLQIVYPVHLNPNVQEPVYRLLSRLPNVWLLPPLDYAPFVHLLKRATLVLTDSGGLQEEAPGLGVPVLVLRQVTERPEGIQAGTVRLVGTDRTVIVAETCRLLDDPQEYARMARAVNPYGDGHAAERIVEAILQA
jgi:UDP-N-acetylglucosamine 2-epimerase (non-hydrolysing)